MPQLGAHLLHLDLLPAEVARDVLHSALATAAPADRRVLEDPGAADQLCELCGRLPLALQIAAALLISDPGKPVAELVSELTGSATLLDHLDDGERGVRAAFDLSYRRLGPESARLFRLLALAPGSETSDEAITVLCGSGAPPRRELAVLIRAHLVVPGSVRGCWTLHDLVRAYALDLVSRREELRREGTRARDRLLAHYLRRAEAADWYLQARVGVAPTAGFDGLTDALSWLERERTGLVSAALWAADPAHARTGLGLALRLHGYLGWQRYFDDAVAVFRCAAEAADALGDGLSAGKAWNCLGLALRNKRGIEEAVAAHTRACEIHRERGDRHAEGTSWDLLGISLTEAHRLDDAVAAHRRARDLVHACGDRQAEASTWNNLGRTLFKLGRFDESVVALTRAREMFGSVGDRFRAATATNNLGRAYRETGRVEEALTAHTTARAVFEELGNRERAATAWNDLGVALSVLGRVDEALDAHLSAVRAYQDLGDRHRQAVTSNDLGATLRRAGRRAEARDAHFQALRLFREFGDTHGERETLGHLAATERDDRSGEAGNR
nr:tetratricopeptide repeat protein [Streptomyces sp. SID161]